MGMVVGGHLVKCACVVYILKFSSKSSMYIDDTAISSITRRAEDKRSKRRNLRQSDPIVRKRLT